jgi:hypothetical protein
MSASTATLRCDEETGAFLEILCCECFTNNTNQRCLATVAEGGYFVGETGRRVCGAPICTDCAASDGNSLYIRCCTHSSSGGIVEAVVASTPVIHSPQEDIRFDEKGLSAMSKAELIELCQKNQLFTHNGSKSTKKTMIPQLIEWQYSNRRKAIVAKADIADTMTFDNTLARVDYCIEILTDANVPVASEKSAARMSIQSNLMEKQNSVNAALAAYVITKFPAINNDTTSPVLQEPVLPPPAALNKNEYGRMLMCIFMPENAPAVSAIRAMDAHELAAAEVSLDSSRSSSPSSTGNVFLRLVCYYYAAFMNVNIFCFLFYSLVIY